MSRIREVLRRERQVAEKEKLLDELLPAKPENKEISPSFQVGANVVHVSKRTQGKIVLVKRRPDGFLYHVLWSSGHAKNGVHIATDLKLATNQSQ